MPSREVTLSKSAGKLEVKVAGESKPRIFELNADATDFKSAALTMAFARLVLLDEQVMARFFDRGRQESAQSGKLEFQPNDDLSSFLYTMELSDILPRDIAANSDEQKMAESLRKKFNQLVAQAIQYFLRRLNEKQVVQFQLM